MLGEALVDLFPGAEVVGGAPFNVARNLAAFGASPLMVTRIGRDARGEKIAAEFASNRMSTHALRRDPIRPTGVVTVHEAANGPRFAIEPDAAWDCLRADDFVPAMRRSPPDIVYFGTLAQRSEASRIAIRQGLVATEAQRFLDLNLRGIADEATIAEQSLALADVVKVNDDELSRLLQWLDAPNPALPGDDEATAVRRLMHRYDIQQLVVTRGAAGWSCHQRDVAEILAGPSVPVEVCDTVGAGDAFASVLLLGQLQGWPLPQALQRAAEFAATVCTVRGGFSAHAAIAARDRFNRETDDQRG